MNLSESFYAKEINQQVRSLSNLTEESLNELSGEIGKIPVFKTDQTHASSTSIETREQSLSSVNPLSQNAMNKETLIPKSMENNVQEAPVIDKDKEEIECTYLYHPKASVWIVVSKNKIDFIEFASGDCEGEKNSGYTLDLTDILKSS